MILIRIESSWDTEDGDGRTIEVTTLTRSHPSEDPREDTRYFAGGDLDRLKAHVLELIDSHRDRFEGTDRSECPNCGNVIRGEERNEGHCPRCG